jgi:hypothetical protein
MKRLATQPVSARRAGLGLGWSDDIGLDGLGLVVVDAGNPRCAPMPHPASRSNP